MSRSSWIARCAKAGVPQPRRCRVFWASALAVAFGCVAVPDTPEFRSAQAQCRGYVAEQCAGLPGELVLECIRQNERACMAELGFGWDHGYGWVRRVGTDRDVRLELDGELRKRERLQSEGSGERR